MSADRLEAVCARLEAAVTRLESGGAGAGGAVAGGGKFGNHISRERIF